MGAAPNGPAIVGSPLVSSETNEQLVARAVDQLTRRTRFPVAFGGLERDGSVHVSAISGARTQHLRGLVVGSGRGLGGKALIEKRPRLTLDYGASRTITHDYDRAVLGEGIATLFAVPVVVSGRARGVIYCGTWSESGMNDGVAGPACEVAAELATELRVRDEVERRVSLAPVTAPVPTLGSSAREELRESYAELRSIAASVEDAGLRRRLEVIERRLAALSTESPVDATPLDVRLSPRETDVLACAALGATNAEIAATLALREVTVKSYLQAAMAKLDASTRHAAVAKARRAGLLP